MAATYCLAMLAGFCFHSQNIDAQLQDFGLGYVLTVKTPTYEASTGQTDVIRSFDWRHEPKICAGTNCVRYHIDCAPSAGHVVCDYQIAFVGEVSGGSIRVTAANDADMAKAQGEISLWFGSTSPMLALSALPSVAESRPLVPCPTGTDVQLCNPQ
ncbi:MAG TPA: hypothetical protein VGP48_01920 [Stellaceae bacterium]|jgi:hypothetical protein|nr:hypothetical protein [Stellaceae bacterium]